MFSFFNRGNFLELFKNKNSKPFQNNEDKRVDILIAVFTTFTSLSLQCYLHIVMQRIPQKDFQSLCTD